MLIRRAISNDAAAIARVQIEGWRTTYRGIVADEFLDAMSLDERTAQWSENLEQATDETLVAVDDEGRVIAFASCGSERAGRGDYDGELLAIYILPEWRRHGIGKRLVAEAAGALAASGKKNMLVWVLADNPSRRFYERLGGRFVGQQPLEIGKQALIEVAYGWDDLEPLLQSCPAKSE
jgi:ribosomal protein S18 acetylase RimI-like enzyme